MREKEREGKTKEKKKKNKLEAGVFGKGIIL